MKTKAHVTPPNFDLQKKLGAPIKHLPLSIVSAADRALARHAATFDGFFQDVTARWKSLPNIEVDQLYKDAHDLRCMAGTFDRIALGRVADCLCLYIDAANSTQSSVDLDAIKAIKDALFACAAMEKTDPEASTKLADHAREAVKIKVAAFQRG
jgi:hypothetical protein